MYACVMLCCVCVFMHRHLASLYWLIGHHDGIEARAINNLRNHVTQNNYGDGIDYWSPTVNMQRDPRWGRNQEVPGEDPTLTG